MSALVSIIIPTFNRAYILDKAIKSVLGQTYRDWEMIIVDDGSVDKTKELVESFREPRIKYLYQENRGASAARNKAFTLAQGEWIAYLDSDNVLFPDYLEVMLKSIEPKGEIVFAFPKGHRYLELYLDGRMVERQDHTNEFTDNITVQDIFQRKLHTDLTGLMHSKKVFEEGIKFDENLKRLEDWDLILTLGGRYPNKFLYVNTLLYTYRQRFGGDGLVSSSSYREWAEIFEYIYQKHKTSKLMAGQSWYPDRVNKWNKLAADYEKGLIPPYHLWYFKNFWPKQTKTPRKFL